MTSSSILKRKEEKKMGGACRQRHSRCQSCYLRELLFFFLSVNIYKKFSEWRVKKVTHRSAGQKSLFSVAAAAAAVIAPTPRELDFAVWVVCVCACGSVRDKAGRRISGWMFTEKTQRRLSILYSTHTRCQTVVSLSHSLRRHRRRRRLQVGGRRFFVWVG